MFEPRGSGACATGRSLLGLAACLLVASHALAQGPVAAPGPLRVVWERDLPDSPAPMIAAAAGRVFLSTLEGTVTAVEARGGTPSWRRRLPDALGGAPVAAGNALAVPLLDGTLLLLDAATGAPVRSYRTRTAAPLILETPGGLFLADREGGIGHIPLAPGAPSWNAAIPAPAVVAAMCGDAILAGLADGALALIDPRDGSLRWMRHLGGPVTTPPLCRGDRAWVGSADDRLYSLGLKRRGFRVRWAFNTGGDLVGPPRIHDGMLIFFSYDTYVYALDEGNGHLSWKARLGLRPAADAVLWGDLLVVAARNAERIDLFRLPAGTQESTWDLETGRERFVTPPVAADGVIVIGAARYGEKTSRAIALEIAPR